MVATSRLLLKCDGTRADTRFRLSAKQTSPFKSAGASVQSTTGSRGVRISGSNAGYTMFRGSVKSTGYPLHSPVSPSLALPCVTVCQQVSIGLYPFLAINKLLISYFLTPLPQPIPVAARTKGWVCGCSFARIVGSNPAEEHGCRSLVSVVYCPVEVSSTG